MSAISRRPEADPLYAGPQPERAAYATGMLLDAQDFIDEQTYHRGRLARALALLAGGGTLAGLEVTHRPADAEPGPRKSGSRRASPSTASAGSSRFRGPPACGWTAGSPARSRATAAIRFAPRPMTTSIDSSAHAPARPARCRHAPWWPMSICASSRASTA